MIKETFKKGFIPNVLMQNPGTFKMLEKIYLQEGAENEIDRYFIESKSGQALRDRLNAVISYGILNIPHIISSDKDFRIANYGCGTARDTIAIALTLRLQNINLNVDCFDVDAEALTVAEALIKFNQLDGFRLLNQSFFSVRGKYSIALLIGILCSLPSAHCITLLKRLKKNFSRGSKLIASNVLPAMKKYDPDMAYTLKSIIGWSLVYKNENELKYIFEEAGYKWLGCFYDEPLRYHVIGIGTPK